jgi:hypothetical protein
LDAENVGEKMRSLNLVSEFCVILEHGNIEIVEDMIIIPS